MEAVPPILSTNDNITHAIEKLRSNPAVLVSEYGKLVGILTNYDVLDMV